MPVSFAQQLEVFTHRATESEVEVALCDMSQGRIRAFRGELRGPHCRRARTLAASFEISRCECDAKVSQVTSVLVTDPCYWSPELPMWYDALLELELADGTTAAWRHSFGLRRWEIHGRDLFRERKRVVLRGAVVDECSPEVLRQAADAELALVVCDPDEAAMQHASELGVVLVADLRQFAGDLTPKLLSHAWQPSVALVLLDEHVPGAHYKPHAARIACGFTAAEWADVRLLELPAGERPPAWAASCPQPVIAIRRGGAYAELGWARQECDRLQAELVPQFDLAGYFV